MNVPLRATMMAVILTTSTLLILWVADYGKQNPCILFYDLSHISCLLRSQADLAGGVIGSAGTIFAGYLAWLSVKQSGHEIAATARKAQADAKEVAVFAVYELLTLVLTVDVMSEAGLSTPHDSVAARIKANIQRLIEANSPFQRLEILQELARELSAEDRLMLWQTIMTARHLFSFCDKPPLEILNTKFFTFARERVEAVKKNASRFDKNAVETAWKLRQQQPDDAPIPTPEAMIT
ncbi:MAG TPA: hypothetical protein PL193_11530 [Xanthobacteraceae bacterium]|nr:hypothetical protein [Xanthobacteraceae bacterium]